MEDEPLSLNGRCKIRVGGDMVGEGIIDLFTIEDSNRLRDIEGTLWVRWKLARRLAIEHRELTVLVNGWRVPMLVEEVTLGEIRSDTDEIPISVRLAGKPERETETR